MREFLILVVHLLVTVIKLLRPGGARAVAAESVLLRQPLIIGNRTRRRAPNLTLMDRLLLGVDKDVVRRVLFKHYCGEPSGGGPSWLTFFADARMPGIVCGAWICFVWSRSCSPAIG